MQQVTRDNLDAFVELYAQQRGGALNEETDSEAMFVLLSKYSGTYILSTGCGVMWIGLQNASARWSFGGEPFPSVRAALEAALRNDLPTPKLIGCRVFYSSDAVDRLTWLAARIAEFKASGDFLIHT